MINPDLFAAYSVATAILILLPGPIVTLVVANSIAHGHRTGLATVAGASIGNALLVAAGALGLTTLLALLADIFEWVRWAGVAYLIYLGTRHWRAAVRAHSGDTDVRPLPARGVLWQGILVAVTNPKTVLFYAAFFPQFLDPTLPVGPQLAIMSVAFVIIGTTFDGAYALLAGRLRSFMVDPRRARLRHGISGTLLIGTGVGLALARRG